MVVRINVTRLDIERGESCVCRECPIARAVRRTKFFKTQDAGVGVEMIFSNLGCFLLPEVALDFRHKFDCFGNTRVKPFSFTINTKEHLVR